MRLQPRRGTYDFSYRQDGINQAMKLCSVFNGGVRYSSVQSVSVWDNVELPLSLCRNRCCHDRPPLVFLRFDHTRDLPLAKAKLSSFWQLLTSAGLQGPHVNKLRSHTRRKSDQSDQLSIMMPPQKTFPKEESPECKTTSVHLDSLKNIFDLFLSKGLDKAALAIENDYRVHPYVCVCREPCCNCVKYSQHLHKLGLHHEKDVLNEKGVETKKKRKERKFLSRPSRSKSFLEASMSVTSKEKTPVVQEQTKISSTNIFRNVFDNKTFEINLDVDESETTVKKEPIKLEDCLSKMSVESYRDSVSVKERISKIRILEETEPEIPQHEPIKCHPSVRSVRRNFKEIDPQKYQRFLEEIAEKPDDCLLSHQSKKERVLRPKVVQNSDQKPKWRI